MLPATSWTDSIWLLSTKGRPALCQGVLDACEKTGMRSQGILWVDETVDQYRDIRLPSNWEIIYRKRWGGIATAMNWVFKRYPKASHYGWLADDSFPRSGGWDEKIEKAAGDWFLAYGQDRYVSADAFVRHLLPQGRDLGAPLCWGGNLVRAVGWWALPGVKQAGIDTAWIDIIQPLKLYRYIPEVICEHRNYRTGKRPYDDTDSWVRNGVNFIQRDIDRRNAWSASWELPATIERVREAMC